MTGTLKVLFVAGASVHGEDGRHAWSAHQNLSATMAPRSWCFLKLPAVHAVEEWERNGSSGLGSHSGRFS